ncbi:reverse transcriptase domain-containing protein [Halomonas sp. H10-9-1]|uniref:reverse transcriptase domain-containing protein n=1 Tax=Halomonas sp. H10-9-1 TaxID=2950871 RepID=UPI0032DE797D
MPSYPRWSSRFELKPGSWVYVPTKETSEEGRLIKDKVENFWKVPKYYYHLKSGGHVAALRSHAHHKFFARLDIKNFFSSVGKSRITRSLKGYVGYPKARDIAEKSTVTHPNNGGESFANVLPFGFVQSPVIASLCLSKSALGRFLSEVYKDKRFSVSVYMDDIILSSDDADRLRYVYDEARRLAERSRFPINDRKSEPPSGKITAFNIELSSNSLEITRERLGELMEEYDNSNSKDQKEGILGYVRSVNERQAMLFFASGDLVV